MRHRYGHERDACASGGEIVMGIGGTIALAKGYSYHLSFFIVSIVKSIKSMKVMSRILPLTL